jgi:hypothetical protein
VIDQNPVPSPSISPSTPDTESPDAGSLSRRKFLGGVGGLAAVMATGATGLTPLIDSGSQAAASEIGPLTGNARLNAAYNLRIQLANAMQADGIPSLHPCNGDEALYANRIGSFSKGLTHRDDIGEVVASRYTLFLNGLNTGTPASIEAIPLQGSRLWVNPQAGLAFDTEGNDPHQFTFPVAPAFASAEIAGEAVELYWMALLRDVNFTDYATNPVVAQACTELSGLTDFRGPKVGGVVTPQTLFRDDLPGALTGPYISQFMLKGTPFGTEYVVRMMRTLLPNTDFMTDYFEWLLIQNGEPPQNASVYDNTRRYIRNGRDLGEWVHLDVLFQAYFNACLILATPPHSDPTVGGIGCPFNPGNPYHAYTKQEPFGTWGGPFIKSILAEVATRALKAVWFQKWFVHRRLRPEAFGGRVHVHKNGFAAYPIHADVLNSQALADTLVQNGTYLLSQVFPEGSPMHPSYGAGHGTVAGACVTILKALFDGSFPVPDPVVPSSDGLALVPTTANLTVNGELNKLASNVATGRNIAGVHWRSDGISSLLLGEQVAIKLLRDHKMTFNEGGSFSFTGFAGNSIVI